MIRINDVSVGDKLRSLDPRDAGRIVRVIEVHPHYGLFGGRIRVERVGSGRRTFISLPTTRWEFTTLRGDHD